MVDENKTVIEYHENNPFTRFGVHDLAMALAEKAGIAQEYCKWITLFELKIDHATTCLRIEYVDHDGVTEEWESVLQEFEFLARPITVKRSALQTEEELVPTALESTQK